MKTAKHQSTPTCLKSTTDTGSRAGQGAGWSRQRRINTVQRQGPGRTPGRLSLRQEEMYPLTTRRDKEWTQAHNGSTVHLFNDLNHKKFLTEDLLGLAEVGRNREEEAKGLCK